MEHGSGIFRLTECSSVLARDLGGFGRTCGKWIDSWDTDCAPLAGVPCYIRCGNDLQLFCLLKHWADTKPSFGPNGITELQTWRSVCIDVWSLASCSRVLHQMGNAFCGGVRQRKENPVFLPSGCRPHKARQIAFPVLQVNVIVLCQ